MACHSVTQSMSHPVLHSPALYIAEFALSHCGSVCGWLRDPGSSLEKSTTPLPSIICILALEGTTELFSSSPEKLQSKKLCWGGITQTVTQLCQGWLCQGQAFLCTVGEVRVGMQDWQLLKIPTADGNPRLHIQHRVAAFDER